MIKKFTLLIIISIVSLNVFSQAYIEATVTPMVNTLGCRVYYLPNLNSNYSVGLNAAFDKGNCYSPYENDMRLTRYSAGISLKMDDWTLPGGCVIISANVNRNLWQSTVKLPDVSMEIGLNLPTEKISISMSFDPIVFVCRFGIGLIIR